MYSALTPRRSLFSTFTQIALSFEIKQKRFSKRRPLTHPPPTHPEGPRGGGVDAVNSCVYIASDAMFKIQFIVGLLIYNNPQNRINIHDIFSHNNRNHLQLSFII